jgi:geranylgeranyl diphosphate synthase type I
MSTPDALLIPAAAVEARLAQVLNEQRSQWTAVDPLLGEIVDRLDTLVMSGGKRVRPAMAYWGFVGGGGDPTNPEIANLGAALELLQAFALFHDDVMDGSPTRRGIPTAHTSEITRHEAGEWSGEARRYGEAIAILAGDISLVLSDVLLSDVGPDVRRLWDQLRIEVNLGQFLDVAGTVRGAVDEDTATRIIDYKTARYTIVRPLQMGAALADAPELGPALERIGRPLGLAFQLRDDLLGAFGDSAVTGKPVGDDLREAKPTPLLARARSLANEAQQAILSLVGGTLYDPQIAQVQETLIATGAVAEIEAEVASLTAKTLSEIRATPLAADASEHLTHLAEFLAGRTH